MKILPENCIRINKIGKSNVTFWIIIFGLVLMRLIKFAEIPGGINQDGAMAAVDAKALADYGTDRFGTFMPAHLRAWGYGQMSALLSYTMVPFIKILGLNKIAMRLPILIFSLLGIGAVYGLVKKGFDAKAKMAALLLLAVNPWHFMQSRWALDCNLFPHMFVLGLFFLINGFMIKDCRPEKATDSGCRPKKWSLYFSMFFFALSMYCYGVSFYMVPVFLLISCVLLLIQRQVTWKDAAISIGIYFGISWPIYGTMLINFMKWETVRLPFVTMEFFESSIRSADMLIFSENIKEQFLINLRALVNVVFLQKEDLLWNSIREFGPMYRGTLPFVILGAALCMKGAVKEKEKDKRICCQILLAFWTCSLLTGLMINSVNINRINIVFYIHIIFEAMGISFVIQKWRVLTYVLLTVFMLQSMLFFHKYFTDWAKEIERAFYGDFVEALAWAENFDSGQYYITPDTQYEGSWNVTEILTLFVFDVDAGYYQGNTDFFRGRNQPFRERFLYCNPPDGGHLPEAVYVFKSSDMDKFAGSRFSITFFGDYSVAVPVTEPESSP